MKSMLANWVAKWLPSRTVVKVLHRYFESGESDRFNTAARGVPVHVNDAVYWNLTAMKGVSRDQRRNNEYYKRHVRLYQKNVVGPRGIQFQNEALHRDGSPDESVNDRIEMAWADFSRASQFSVSNQESRCDVERLFVSSILSDGEFIARKFRGFGNRHGFALQVLDSARLDVHLNEVNAETGNRIIMGVEVDANLRPVRYWFRGLPDALNFSVAQFYTGQARIGIPASEIIHAFIKEDPEQVRGYPPNQAALRTLRDTKGYRDAAVIAMREGANQLGFLKTEDPPELEEDRDGNQVAEDLNQSEPGEYKRIPLDWEVDVPDPKYPNDSMEDAIRTILQGSAAGMDLSYNAVAQDATNVNQSTMRWFGADDYETYLGFFGFLVESFERPVFEEWLALQPHVRADHGIVDSLVRTGEPA